MKIFGGCSATYAFFPFGILWHGYYRMEKNIRIVFYTVNKQEDIPVGLGVTEVISTRLWSQKICLKCVKILQVYWSLSGLLMRGALNIFVRVADYSWSRIWERQHAASGLEIPASVALSKVVLPTVIHTVLVFAWMRLLLASGEWVNGRLQGWVV